MGEWNRDEVCESRAAAGGARYHHGLADAPFKRRDHVWVEWNKLYRCCADQSFGGMIPSYGRPACRG